MRHWYTGEDEHLNYGEVTELIDDGDGGILVRCSNFGTLDISSFPSFFPMIGDKVELFTDGGGWIVTHRKDCVPGG